MQRKVMRSLVTGIAAVALLTTTGCASAQARDEPVQTQAASAKMQDVLNYLRSQNTTGFVVIENGRTLVDQAWAPPSDNRLFSAFLYGRTSEGVLLEDVASQQKSFIAVLVAIAVDKGLIDVEQPVSHYLGQGWSKASAEQEAQIRVIHLLQMNTGLDEGFAYTHPAGSQFFYNTPVYAMTKNVLTAASGQSLDTLTRVWLTEPLGMKDTDWRERPAAVGASANNTALVTTPMDIAQLGLMVLNGGRAKDGSAVVSPEQLEAMFQRSDSNPAYGRLWWLNGSDYTVRGAERRSEGPLIAAAPSDLVAAFGLFERRLYVVPGRKLVVVRTGAAASDKDFDQQLWLRLMQALDQPSAVPAAD